MVFLPLFVVMLVAESAVSSPPTVLSATLAASENVVSSDNNREEATALSPGTAAAMADTERVVTHTTGREVPFYSQFTDISDPAWQGVGCGIASIAMLINYYTGQSQDLDTLLADGRAAGAFLEHAGWTHAGLLELARPSGLTGQSISLQDRSEAAALAELKRVLAEGPVMASVYYTFEEFNPIPHLVVITDAVDGYIYYNDPAEPTGNGRLSEADFSRGWKERYILVRPMES